MEGFMHIVYMQSRTRVEVQITRLKAMFQGQWTHSGPSEVIIERQILHFQGYLITLSITGPLPWKCRIMYTFAELCTWDTDLHWFTMDEKPAGALTMESLPPQSNSRRIVRNSTIGQPMRFLVKIGLKSHPNSVNSIGGWNRDWIQCKRVRE